MGRVALLLPTRQRPEYFVRFMESALNTADRPEDVLISAYIDKDDSTYDHLIFPTNVFITIGPRIILSEMWNRAFDKVKDQAEYFGHMGDDIVFRSKSWDTQIKEAIDAYPKKIAFVWGDDSTDQSQRNEFGTHGFVHKNWCDVIGRFVPPYFSSDYNDTWFNDVAQALNVRRYLHDVKTEHCHISLGKMPIDQNAVDRLTRHAKDRPDEIYNSQEKRIERLDEIEKLREFINA